MKASSPSLNATHWNENGREEWWWCSKCGTEIKLYTKFEKDRKLADILDSGLPHHGIKEICSKPFVCFGIFKKIGSDPFFEEVTHKTTWGYTVDYYELYKQNKGYDELETVICTARQKVFPYHHYTGKSGHKDINKIQNKRLLTILETVKEVEPWSVYNCAEVKSAEKLLNKNPDIKPGTIEFEAIDKYGKRRPPCKNCVQWINKV